MAAVLQKLVDLGIAPCLEDDESYATRSRKMASIAVSIITSPALFLGMPVTILTALFDPKVGAYLISAAMFQMVITSSIIPYAFLRRTKRLPDWLVDFQIWSTVPMSVLFALFSHHSVVSIGCSMCSLLGILMRTRGWGLLLLIGISINVVHVLANGYVQELPILHETFYSPELLSVRIIFLIGVNISPLFFFGLGLHAIMMEFVERADQADAAIHMCIEVAGKLRRYDTEAVGAILAANQGKVDANLLEAFSAIQCNLQDYRPHIPEYVIANSSTTSSSSEGGLVHDEDDEDEDVDESVWVGSTSFNPTSSRSSYIQVQGYSTTSISDTPHQRYAPPGTRSATSRASHCPDAESVSSASADFTVVMKKQSLKRSKIVKSIAKNESIAVSVGSSTDTGRTAEIAASKQRHHFYGRATTVFVRFVAQSCGSDGSGNGFVQKGNVNTAMDVLSKCLEAASHHAKIHGGALQYMQGCGLMVSFNAASRVLSYEASACAFALNLKAAVDEQLGGGKPVVMHASIVTSQVLSFFAGNGGQLMLTVLGGFMPQHAAIHHYLGQTVGPASSCVVMNNSVIPAIEMVFEHRLLGGFSIQPNTASSLSPVVSLVSKGDVAAISQLTRARKATTGDEEWMYHAVTTDPDDPVSEAVKSVLDGDMVDPSTIRSYCADDIVLTKCVLDRLEMCAREEGTFSASVVPTVLW